MKKFDVRLIAYLGMLTALGVALRFVSITTEVTRISFGFIPIAAAGMLFGPIPAGIVGALIDVLGAFLFPTGAFFPGYTLTAFVTGLCWGIPFLHGKRSVPRLLLAVASNLVLCTLLLNTYWNALTRGAPFLPTLAPRLVQAAVMAPIQFLLGGLLMKLADRYGDRLVRREK